MMYNLEVQNLTRYTKRVLFGPIWPAENKRPRFIYSVDRVFGAATDSYRDRLSSTTQTTLLRPWPVYPFVTIHALHVHLQLEWKQLSNFGHRVLNM